MVLQQLHKWWQGCQQNDEGRNDGSNGVVKAAKVVALVVVAATKTPVVAEPTMAVVVRNMGILFSKILKVGISYFHFC